MLTGALTTQLPEDQGDICGWELSHSTQKITMPKEAGFGTDTLWIILPSQRAPRLMSKCGTATRTVFWSPGKQSRS